MILLPALVVSQLLFVAVTSSSPVLRDHIFIPLRSSHRRQQSNAGENGLLMTNKNNQNPNQWVCFCPNDIHCACRTEDAMDSGILQPQDMHQPVQRNSKIWHQKKENKQNTNYGQTNINKREPPMRRTIITDPCTQGIPPMSDGLILTLICVGDPSNCERNVREALGCRND